MTDDRLQLRMSEAIDLWLGELARQSRTPATRILYRQILNAFADLYEHKPLHAVTADDCRRFLDRWADAAPQTLAIRVTVLTGFFTFMWDEGHTPASPMQRIKRPRTPRAEDLDVVTVTGSDVERLFAAVESWQELVCLAFLAYLGPRRNAAAQLRWRDVDLHAGTARFKEKGRKIIEKPLPAELVEILETAAAAGGLDTRPDEFVIPNLRARRKKLADDRDDNIVWSTVRRVADRAGVRTHPHALRAAFAVRFLEQHQGDAYALKHLLGHARMETTEIYLRRHDKRVAMERVRDLSWEAKGDETMRVTDEYAFQPPGLPDGLWRKLDELKKQARDRSKEPS